MERRKKKCDRPANRPTDNCDYRGSRRS